MNREMLTALLETCVCDSDISLTCRDNWPDDTGSWCGGCQILAVGEALALAEQQVEVLKPGGLYAWKCKAEQAEAELAALRQQVERLEAALTALREERDSVRRRSTTGCRPARLGGNRR